LASQPHACCQLELDTKPECYGDRCTEGGPKSGSGGWPQDPFAVGRGFFRDRLELFRYADGLAGARFGIAATNSRSSAASEEATPEAGGWAGQGRVDCPAHVSGVHVTTSADSRM